MSDEPMGDRERIETAEQWATIALALARDVNRIKVVCEQEHPPKMGSPTKDWPAGTETRHSDGTRCVLLEDGDYAVLLAALPSLADQVRALADDEMLVEAVWFAMDDHGHNSLDCRPERPMAYTAAHVLRALADALDGRTNHG